jgi:hypothetical protein
LTPQIIIIEENMKAYILLIFLFVVISNGFSQNPSDEENKSINDVVIKETYETGTEEEKLPIQLKSDFTNLVEIQERIQWSSVPLTFSGEYSTFNLFEFKTSEPDLVGIMPEPAKVFHVTFNDLASWRLNIFASDGSNFRTLSGEGNPPSAIVWDGRGDSGAHLIPGQQYSYSFTAVDKAGNRRTFPGESFSVPAIFLKNNEDVWIGLSNDLLFSPNGYGLLKSAEKFSSELVNFIYYYANKGKIKIQSGHPDTEKFIELLAKKLGKDVNFFKKVSNSDAQNCFMMWLN